MNTINFNSNRKLKSLMTISFVINLICICTVYILNNKFKNYEYKIVFFVSVSILMIINLLLILMYIKYRIKNKKISYYKYNNKETKILYLSIFMFITNIIIVIFYILFFSITMINSLVAFILFFIVIFIINITASILEIYSRINEQIFLYKQETETYKIENDNEIEDIIIEDENN